MAVFYRGPRAHVTDREFHTSQGSFAIAELSFVHIVQTGGFPPTGAFYLAGGGTLLAGAAFGQVLQATSAWAAGLFLVSILGGACLRVRKPGSYALQAVYRGAPVTLYLSSDLREFGQVRRALLRARELCEE